MTASNRKSTGDKELEAMGVILHALDDLDGDSIQRVLDYVFSRLSIAAPRHLRPSGSEPPTQTSVDVESPLQSHSLSIRDLKNQKLPESSNQMAALVAYYLSEVLSDANHKDSISTADLERYFKQAGFKLPKTLSATLSNATAAGYFDALGNGQYKLNPVGYNLVVHGLPRAHSASERARKTPSKRPHR